MSYPYKVNNAFYIFIKSQKLKYSITVLFSVFPVFLFSKYYKKFFKMGNACLISTGHSSCHITCLLSVYRYKKENLVLRRYGQILSIKIEIKQLSTSAKALEECIIT